VVIGPYTLQARFIVGTEYNVVTLCGLGEQINIFFLSYKLLYRTHILHLAY